MARRYPPTFSACPDGQFSARETRVQEFTAGGGAVLDTSEPCAPDRSTTPASSQFLVEVGPSMVTVYGEGKPYLVPDVSIRATGTFSVQNAYMFGNQGAAPELSIPGAPVPSQTGAEISGTINPNGPGSGYPYTAGTKYHIEYKKASESDWKSYAPDTVIGLGNTPEPFSVGLDGLDPNTPYEAKVVVIKPFIATISETKSFTTSPAPPKIAATWATDQRADGATLHAKINPQGTDTDYYFEYGTTPEYGNKTPVTNIGEALSFQTVANQIEGLSPVTYHFRVAGTTGSGPSTAQIRPSTFNPPTCPNQSVRQQHECYLPTGLSRLRAHFARRRRIGIAVHGRPA